MKSNRIANQYAFHSDRSSRMPKTCSEAFTICGGFGTPSNNTYQVTMHNHHNLFWRMPFGEADKEIVALTFAT